VRAHLDDEQYRLFQLALLLRPEYGRLIPGSGGLRKARWAVPGRGKRGGLRIIYYWNESESTIYCLFAYRKNDQGDLTKTKIRMLRRLVEEELNEARSI
jgi:hypothetical protein